MTVSNTHNRMALYDCNGVTTDFSFTFEILSEEDLVVILVDGSGSETVQTLNSDYTVTGAGDPSGGSISFTTAPSDDYELLLMRDTTVKQLADYVSNDTFPAETHENALDKLTLIVQELHEELQRAARFRRTSTVTDMQMPVGSDVASRILALDSTGEQLTTLATTTVARTVIDSLDEDHSGSLATMVSNIGAGNKTVLVDTTNSVDADLTIPSNIHLIWLRGGKTTIANTKTLTLNCSFSAGNFQIFDGDGDVDFGNGSIPMINSGWFGTDEVAIQSALDSAYRSSTPGASGSDLTDWMGRGPSVYVPGGSYTISTGLKTYAHIELIFDIDALLTAGSADMSVIRTAESPSTTIPTQRVGYPIIRNPKIDMDSNDGFGILFECAESGLIDNPIIYNVSPTGYSYNDGNGAATYLSCGVFVKGITGTYGAYYNKIENPTILGASSATKGDAGIHFGTSDGETNQKANSNRVSGGRIHYMEYGIYVEVGNDNIIDQVDLSINTTCIFDKTNRTIIISPYMENATTGIDARNATNQLIIGEGNVNATTPIDLNSGVFNRWIKNEGPESVKLYRDTSGQTITDGAAAVKVDWNNTDWDIGSNADLVNDRWKAPQNGLYHVDAQIKAGDTVAGKSGKVTLELYCGASNVVFKEIYHDNFQDNYPAISSTVYCDAGDNIALYVGWENDTDATDLTIGTGKNYTYMTIHQVI